MIKRGLFFLVFLLAFSSLASAEIIVQNQPSEVYNLGDSSQIVMKIKTPVSKTGVFYMDLICNGQTVNFYKNGVSLTSGEERKLEASLVFAKSLIGEAKGKCLVKGIFGEEYALTNEFTLSDHIDLSLNTGEGIFIPKESILIEGNAVKSSGQPANGYIDLEIILEGQTNPITSHETILNGFFSVNITLPEGTKAGKHLLKITAYEEDFSGERTNSGFINQNINVAQVPTSLELIFENEVEPGIALPIKAILHDQTGESIESSVKITIKDDKNKIIKESEQSTSEEFILNIAYNEEPSTWKILAVSGEITTESSFSISEKKYVDVSLVNNTLTITNKGNVYYEGPVMVKINDKDVILDVALKVDESVNYKLSAPDGEYKIAIFDNEKERLTQSTFLTGKAISAKEKKSGSIFSLAWIFLLLVFGFVAYMFFNKGRKRSFFARMPKFFKKKETPADDSNSVKKNSKLNLKNPAFVSLSIKGEKQKSCVMALHIKNLEDIQKTKGNAEEVLQKIVDFAEEQKALTYENNGNLFFILAPVKTKTFQNEKTALKIAQMTKEILFEHNRLFKQKIKFGISINDGVIIAKPSKNLVEFMSMGNFMTGAKKMANQSDGEILFSREIGNRLNSEIKIEKSGEQDDIYHIKEFREHNAESKKFIDSLVRKWEREEGEKR